MNIKTRRLLNYLILIVVIAAVLLLILIKGPLAPLKVTTASVQQGDLQPAVFGVGTVEARRSYSIGPIRSGRLIELRVDHGDSVTQGELIGRMDPVDLPARLLAAQKVREKLEHSIAASQAKVDETKQRLQQARDEAQRYVDLAKKGLASTEQNEARQTELRTTKLELLSAEAGLDAARHDYERSAADIQALQAQINDLDLKSPANGLIISRNIEPGSVVIGGTAVVNMIDPDSLWVRTRIDQASSAQLKKNLHAQILLRTRQQPLAGQVERLELVADSLTEERWVDVAFSQTASDIAIGSLANVTIDLPKVKGAQWLPAAAIHHIKNQTGVWIIQQGKAHFKALATGAHTLDGKVEIIDRLPKDFSVITYSPRSLKEGDRVKIDNGGEKA